MSTKESKRNPSQGKPENLTQGKSTQPQGKPGAGSPRALPFDDDDTGTDGVSETSNPQHGTGGGIGQDL